MNLINWKALFKRGESKPRHIYELVNSNMILKKCELNFERAFFHENMIWKFQKFCLTNLVVIKNFNLLINHYEVSWVLVFIIWYSLNCFYEICSVSSTPNDFFLIKVDRDVIWGLNKHFKSTLGTYFID